MTNAKQTYTFDELTKRVQMTVIDKYANDEAKIEVQRWSGYSCADTFAYLGWYFTKNGQRV